MWSFSQPSSAGDRISIDIHLRDTISRTNASIFNDQSHRKKTKSQEMVTLLKARHRCLQSCMLTVRQDMVTWVTFSVVETRHSHHPYHISPISDIMVCLETLAQFTGQARSNSDVAIMDGAVLVNIIRPLRCTTFSDYASHVFVPYINRELH